VAGVVGRPHGLDGSFHVREGRASLLIVGARVVVAGREALIERRAGTDQRPIIRLEGWSGREAAEHLRGERMVVAGAQAPPLDEEEWYAEELEGCRVLDGEREVGEVRRLLALPSCEVLEVARPDGGELLVPLIRDAVREVDVRGRRIDVDLAFLGEEPAS
jgi:16S rRNA processing protein RimM